MKKFIIALFFVPVALGAQSALYVSPAGNNSNPGTLTSPWKTVQYALDHAAAGNTIYLMGGIYHENCIVPASTTMAGAGITLSNYEDETAVLEGNGNAAPLLKISNVNHFTVRGIEFRNNFGNSACGISISGKCNAINVLSNHLHDISFSSDPNAQPSPSSMSFPIIVSGDSATGITNLTISHNEIYNNVISAGSGIQLQGNISWFTIEKNDIHHNAGNALSVFGRTGTCATAMSDMPREGNVRWNTITSNEAGSILATALLLNGADLISVQNNSISQNTIGISVTCGVANTSSSGITVKNNVVFDNTDGGILIGTSGQSYDGNVMNCGINNNTIANNSSGPLHIGELVIHYCDSVKVYNNIVYGDNNNASLVMIDDHHSTTELTNNIYYCAGAPLFTIGTVAYHNHNFFSSALGNDQNSLFTDPLFADVYTNNFHLQGNSPAIDEGEMNYIASYNEVDMDTMARVQNGRVDAGADEYGTAVGIVNPVPPTGTNYSFQYNGDGETVTVAFTEKTKGASRVLTLYAVDGRKIESKNRPEDAGSVTFDVHNLAAGTYVIYLQAENVAYKFIR